MTIDQFSDRLHALLIQASRNDLSADRVAFMLEHYARAIREDNEEQMKRSKEFVQ